MALSPTIFPAWDVQYIPFVLSKHVLRITLLPTADSYAVAESRPMLRTRENHIPITLEFEWATDTPCNLGIDSTHDLVYEMAVMITR